MLVLKSLACFTYSLYRFESLNIAKFPKSGAVVLNAAQWD